MRTVLVIKLKEDSLEEVRFFKTYRAGTTFIWDAATEEFIIPTLDGGTDMIDIEEYFEESLERNKFQVERIYVDKREYR